MSPVGECGYRRRDSGFRRNGNSFNFAVYLFSIAFPFPPPPHFHSRLLHASSTLPFPPPFPFLRRQESLPASAGNSAKAEHCNGRLSANAAVAAEIPAFAGMEGFVELAAAFSFIPSPPIPAKAGISLSSNCFGARCQKTVRDSGRFPLSREWERGVGMEKRGGNKIKKE